MSLAALNSPLKKAFRSRYDKPRVSGQRCAASIYPLMLSLSKHEYALFQRAVKVKPLYTVEPSEKAGKEARAIWLAPAY